MLFHRQYILYHKFHILLLDIYLLLFLAKAFDINLAFVRCCFKFFGCRLFYIYTSIPHDLGLTAIEYWRNTHAETHCLEHSQKNLVILEAISLVLKENTFHFNDKFYRQIQGTAMGSKMAPTYGTLVMDYLEKQMYMKYEKTFDTEKLQRLMNIFKRFLDDCFVLWKQSQKNLEIFYNISNNLHENIQFTMEKDKEQLPFLDILLYKITQTSFIRRQTHISI